MKSPKSRRLSKWDRISVVCAAISAAFAVVAGVAAVRSCEISHVLNEPYVVANPLPYDDTEAYIKTAVYGDAVRLAIRYEIINRGNVPVRGLSIPKNMIVSGALPSTTPPFNIQFPGELTLGPGQSYKLTLETQVRSTNKTGEELEEMIKSGKMTFVVRLVLTYFAQVPDRKDYKVMSEDEFSYNRTRWLKSNFID